MPDTVRVLIVDGGSRDGTDAIADELALYRDRMQVLHQHGLRGIPDAVVAGFRWALDVGVDVVIEIPADGCFDPEGVAPLLERLALSDVVLGARWTPGRSSSRRSAWRWGPARVNAAVRTVLHLPVHDPTSEVRAIRSEALRWIQLGGLARSRHAFHIDFVRTALLNDLTVIEVPINVDRSAPDAPRPSLRDLADATLRVVGWAAGRVTVELRDALG